MLPCSVKILRNPTISNFISLLEPTKIMLPLCRQKRINPFSNEQIVALMNIFDYNYSATYHLMVKHKTLMDITSGQLQKSFEVLRKYGIHKEGIREAPTVLTILPTTIEQHALVLQEGGFSSVTSKLLVSYLTIIRKRLSILKAYGYIASNVNVSEVLMSHLEPELPPLENYVEDDMTYIEVFEMVLYHYLKWKLKMTPEDMERLPKRYKRIRHKSLRLIRESLSILQNTLGFSNEKICKNGYLIHSHPENTLQSLQQLPILGGVDIKSMFSRFPKMIMTATPTLVTTLKHLKEFGITDEAIQRCPHVFTLSSRTVYERLLKIKNVPEFNALMGHPRILRLVYYQLKALSRILYLRAINLNCVSLHILSSPKPEFERYAQEGVDCTRGVDVIYYLYNMLGSTEGGLRMSLQRHQYWCNVPLVSIKETLDALLKIGFTKKEIIHSLHILLYSRNLVLMELDALPHRAELLDNNIISRRHQLAHCLYFIEREHHFTGDGIWLSQEHITIPDTDTEAISHTTYYDTISKSQ